MFNHNLLLRKLQKPEGVIDAVLDTDAYNEIDDQFALAYLLLSKERINPLAVYAAPFSNAKSSGPADGMEKSYDEILKVMTLCGRDDMHKNAFKGSTRYLPDEKTPVESDAARDLVIKALEHSPEKPLYVLAIGAITNVASALLMKPEICENIVVVFLGGTAHHFPPHPEFNMSQDVAAARVVFGSGCALVQLPCLGVVTHLTTTEPELRHHLKGTSKIGDYLYHNVCEEVTHYDGGMAWSRVIWDVSAVAWLLGDKFVWDSIIPAPIPSYDNGYVFDNRRHYIKTALYVERDAIFADLFTKIAACN